MPYPVILSEAARVEALNRTGILDTPREDRFDTLTRMAARLTGSPIALLTFIDRNRLWFKACHGVNLPETDRGSSFCEHTIESRKLMVVEDATKDERFREHPFVRNEPTIRFYAGAPIVTSSGFALGTLCVIDNVPRGLSLHQAAALKALAAQVVEELEQNAGDRRVRAA